ncbi:MAG: TatD family hydrolase [Actinomycetia bacterium]|nr:TatD family hydrolase [Actinomycetes bacterium]
MRWTDNHCHLGYGADAAPIPDALAAARGAGVERFINVGTDLDTTVRAIEVAEQHPEVWATAGLHPHDSTSGLDGLEELLEHPRVVAVGECGLDFYYDNSPRPEQRQAFAIQIGWAHSHDVPLVIHSREAWDDTFAILDSEGVPARTVFHCFTGGPAEAELALERGAHVSYSGIVTFKTATELRAAAALTPLDRLLVETDSPYLAPVPHRGRPNQPAFVALVGEAVARVQGRPAAEVAEATWNNTERFYGLDDGNQ